MKENYRPISVLTTISKVFEGLICDQMAHYFDEILSYYLAAYRMGVPQGSLVGPLLFNIFINDLFMFLEGKCDLFNYADDNTLVQHNTDLVILKSNIESAAVIATEWFTSNKMKANPSKFQAMVLNRKQSVDIELVLTDTVIKSENCVKLLGVIVDNKLTFSDHIKHICSRGARQINALKRLSHKLDTNSKMQIFNSFFVSDFN